jgi:hypothetical protein
MWHFIESFDAVPRDRNLMVAVLDADCFHALEFPCRCNEDGKQSARFVLEPNPPTFAVKNRRATSSKTERNLGVRLPQKRTPRS